MNRKLIVLCSVLAFSYGAPTLPYAESRQAETLNDALWNVAKDSMQVLQSTSGVAQFVGQTAANAAIEGSRVAADYVQALEVEAAVNKTEDAVKAHKIAMIESIFDVKRQALRALLKFKEHVQASINAFASASMDNINAAITVAQQGFHVTKNVTTHLVAQVTLENIQSGVEEAQNAAEEAVINSADTIQESVHDLLLSLVTAKEHLHDLAANFSSQEAFHAGEVNLGMALNATVVGAETLIDQMGVFQSLDNIVHGMADIPKKINSFLPTINANATATVTVETSKTATSDEKKEKPDDVKATSKVMQPDEVEATAKVMQPDEVEATAKVMQPEEVEATAKVMQPDEVEATAKVMQPDEVEATAKVMQPDEVEATARVMQPDEVMEPDEVEATAKVMV